MRFAHSKHYILFESLSAYTQPSNHPSGLKAALGLPLTRSSLWKIMTVITEGYHSDWLSWRGEEDPYHLQLRPFVVPFQRFGIQILKKDQI